MVMVIKGLTPGGKPCVFSIDGYLKRNLDNVSNRVTKLNWDYCAVVSGIPGAGKSNFAQGIARYCCEKFDHTYIAFSDKDFIRITNKCPKYSSVVLDESFQSLNTRVTSSVPFLRIVNHLQLIRQKHLFIFLCLPNFFDLSKGIAIYRSSHLFLVYADKKGSRGFFCAFDREAKKKLYIRGSKFLDYNIVRANFHGRFPKQKAISEKVYESMKRKHLLSQGKQIKLNNPEQRFKFNVVDYLINKEGWAKNKVSECCGVTRKTIYNLLKKKENEN